MIFPVLLAHLGAAAAGKWPSGCIENCKDRPKMLGPRQDHTEPRRSLGYKTSSTVREALPARPPYTPIGTHLHHLPLFHSEEGESGGASAPARLAAVLSAAPAQADRPLDAET